ncbi:MAG: DUF899 domain-containing protein [Rhodospirillales bacterium]|nr:DUF899 domain-containing protein [Rhodospirillales bacterium]MDH3920286.1 DUF899 domain-containing protein [Rhodospirillales bacterium]MDH3968800.1 DUF899 domain-containing protein [Rhodospirillales bacterium]
MSTTPFEWQSDDDRRAREELLAAETALKDQREEVAALRRSLPATVLEKEYEFEEGPADLADERASGLRRTRLSELFSDGRSNLIVVHFMYGPDDDHPCPMCSMWADGYSAVARHVADKADLVLVAKAQVGKFRAWGHKQGWTGLRLLSSRNNAFNADFGVEAEDGKAQYPGVSVFIRGDDGGTRHFYTGTAFLGSGHFRGLDLFTPVWHLFDLLPAGRGDWMPKTDYGEA